MMTSVDRDREHRPKTPLNAVSVGSEIHFASRAVG